jgi:hypothetical protein
MAGSNLVWLLLFCDFITKKKGDFGVARQLDCASGTMTCVGTKFFVIWSC